ncbi:MAG: TIGR02253 family HAD-type hydrolase [Simkaniaceae bacterium]
MFIIFDLDDTLIDTSGTILPVKAKRALQKMLHAGLPLANPEQAFAELMQFLKKAKSSEEGLARFLEPKKNGMDFFTCGFEEIYKGDLGGIDIRPLPKALEVLKELADAHLLSIATIGEKKMQLQKLHGAGIDINLFYRIECLQENKKVFYRQIRDELGIPSKNIFVCGDKVTTDLVPAKELGLNTVHMKWGRGENFTEEIENVDYTIYELSELKKIL